jgi:hypothetical protein
MEFLITIAKIALVFTFIALVMYAFILFMAWVTMKTTKNKRIKKEMKEFLSKKEAGKKGIYVLPWKIFIFSSLAYIIPLFTIVFAILFLPLYSFVKIKGPLGPNNPISDFIDIIKYPLIFFFIFGVGLSWYFNPKSKILRKFKRLEIIPIEKWLTKKIPCSNCSGSLKKCSYNPETSEYECFCKECNKKIIITCDGRHAKIKKT